MSPIDFPPLSPACTFSSRTSPAVLVLVNRPTEPTPLAPIGSLGMTVELPVSTPELEETLHRDRESLVRDALLWQRWVRYAGLLALVVLALVLGERSNRAMLMPLAAVA